MSDYQLLQHSSPWNLTLYIQYSECKFQDLFHPTDLTAFRTRLFLQHNDREQLYCIVKQCHFRTYVSWLIFG